MRGPSTAGSIPSTRSFPSVTGETQPIIRIVELLPAPFGPRNPNASPAATSKSIESTAVNEPNVLVSEWASTSMADRPYRGRPAMPSRKLTVWPLGDGELGEHAVGRVGRAVL